MNDVVIPTVLPDFLIAVNTPGVTITLCTRPEPAEKQRGLV